MIVKFLDWSYFLLNGEDITKEQIEKLQNKKFHLQANYNELYLIEDVKGGTKLKFKTFKTYIDPFEQKYFPNKFALGS